MAWPKGKPRPKGAGRQPGSRNKRTIEVEELFAKHHFNPLERMIALCETPEVSLEIKAALLKELAQYAYPKRKAIEHSGVIAVDSGVLSLEDPLTAEDLALASGRNGSAHKGGAHGP